MLQNFLTRAGVRTTVDGDVRRRHPKAVKAFEAFQQRPVDGVVTRLDVLVLRDVVTNGGAVAKAVEHRRRAAEERRASPSRSLRPRRRRWSSVPA